MNPGYRQRRDVLLAGVCALLAVLGTWRPAAADQTPPAPAAAAGPPAVSTPSAVAPSVVAPSAATDPRTQTAAPAVAPPAPTQAATPLVTAAAPAASAPPDTACRGPQTGWRTPEEIRLTPPISALSAWSLLTGQFSFERFVGTAELRAEEWFGLDKVELKGDELLFEKKYRGRLDVETSAGLGPSADSGVQVEYPLWRVGVVRSETRERGESVLELRRDIHFQ